MKLRGMIVDNCPPAHTALTKAWRDLPGTSARSVDIARRAYTSTPTVFRVLTGRVLPTSERFALEFTQALGGSWDDIAPLWRAAHDERRTGSTAPTGPSDRERLTDLEAEVAALKELVQKLIAQRPATEEQCST